MGRVPPGEWIGSTIDHRYVIEELVGEGGQGVVYRGRHLGFDEPIAVKFLKLPARLAAAQRDDLLESFRAEARLLHRLSRKSAGIVQALDIGAARNPAGEWAPYIVMEWLDGQGLDTFLEMRSRGAGGLPLDEAVHMLAPAAHALSVAHRNGICHLDVKPGNLFLCKSADPPLKILDFGIARMISATTGLTQVSGEDGPHERLLTPAYAAPEQFNVRHGSRGPWTDVFALALVLLEATTGQSPLGEGSISQLYAVSADDQRRPSLAAHGVNAPEGVERALRRALAVEPEARQRDTAELWNELEIALGKQAPRSPATVGAVAWAHLDEAREARGVSVAPTVPASREMGAPEKGTSEVGENRVCSILVAQLGGLAELGARLEPEQMTEMTDRIFGFLAASVEALGGVVDKHIGDAIMAVFGIDRASDNDAERAVRAALDMQRMVASFSLPHRALRRFRIGIGVGIASGRVFVRRGATAPVRVTGAAVNAAGRLGATAEGTVVVDRDTHRLVAGIFSTRRAAPVAPSSAGPPLAAYIIERAHPPRTGIVAQTFHDLPTRTFGRRSELEKLVELFETVETERAARIATIVGNAGLGRTRLIADLADRIGERAVTWVTQGASLAGNDPLRALASLLRHAFHVHEDDPPDVVVSKLRRGVRDLRRDELFPRRRTGTGERSRMDGTEIVDVLARVLGAREAAEADSLAGDDAALRMTQRIAAAFTALVRSSGRPIVVYADDAQWIDDATLDLFDDLSHRASDVPLFIVCTTRPELFERRPLWGEGKEAHVRIEMGPLTRHQLEQIASDRLQRVPEVPEALVRQLAERAEGSPRILDETIHLLIDAGAISAPPEGAWTVHKEALGELELPTTVQGVVQARIDRLDEDQRDVLTRAAILGRTFWDGAIAELGVDPGPALVRLRERGLIHLRDTSLFPDEHEYVFADSATQHVAYESLSLKVRTRMHRVVATWLAARTREAAAALCARHHELAGDLAPAARGYVRAAVHAAELGQHSEALGSYERASSIDEDTLSSTPSARRTSPITLDNDDSRVLPWRERFAMRLGHGDVLRRSGDLEQATRRYEDARDRIVRAERRGGESWDETEVRRMDAQVDHRVALIEQLRGNLDAARELVERSLASGADVAASWALLAAIHGRQDHPDACRTASLQGLRVCRRAEVRDARWAAAVSELLITLGGMFFRKNQLIRAERCYLQAARAVDEREHPYQVSRALNNVAATRYQRGDIAGAGKVFRRVLDLSERGGDLAMTTVVLSNLSEIEHHLGHDDSAYEHARNALRLGEQIGARSDLPDIYRNLAHAALALGEHTEAVDAAHRALDLAMSDAGRVYLAAVAETSQRVAREVPGEDPALEAKLAECMALLEGRTGASRA